MKILQIASGDFFSTYGGGQVYVKHIIDEFIHLNIEMTVLSFVYKSEGWKQKNYKEITLYEIGTRDKIQIKELIKIISPDIIHAHSEKAMMATIGTALNIPVFITAHHGGILCPAGTLLNQKDEICQTNVCHKHCLPCCLKNIRSGQYWYPVMKLLPERFYIKMGRMFQHLPFIPFITPIGQTALGIEHKKQEWNTIINNANLVIAPSYAIAQAMERNGLDKEKIRVVPHGIPMPPKSPTPIITVEEGIQFFYVGRICRVKGIHVLLKAFSEITDKKAKLHLIGGAGNKGEKRYMEKMQRQYAHNRQIIWHGKVKPEQVSEMIQDFHVLIHPTICLEIFGLNIAEALAIGKPVLATRCGGAEMQIEEGVNGWLVAPNDTEALKKNIENIIRDNSIFYPLGMSDKRNVKSIEEHCKVLVKLYKEENKKRHEEKGTL